MTVQRQQVGDAETYRGHQITIEFVGPDMIGRVDGKEFTGAFFMKAGYARDACKRHIDALMSEEEEP